MRTVDVAHGRPFETEGSLARRFAALCIVAYLTPLPVRGGLSSTLGGRTSVGWRHAPGRGGRAAALHATSSREGVFLRRLRPPPSSAPHCRQPSRRVASRETAPPHPAGCTETSLSQAAAEGKRKKAPVVGLQTLEIDIDPTPRPAEDRPET